MKTKILVILEVEHGDDDSFIEERKNTIGQALHTGMYSIGIITKYEIKTIIERTTTCSNSQEFNT